MKSILKNGLLTAAVLACLCSRAQLPETIQQLTTDSSINNLGLRYPQLVSRFYKLQQFQPAWITNSNQAAQYALLHELARANDYGLDEKDYQYTIVAPLRKGQASLWSVRDSVLAELRLTDAAIHFFGEIKNGNATPAFGYDGLKYTPSLEAMPDTVAAYLLSDTINFSRLIVNLEPAVKEYRLMKARLVHFNQMMRDSSFEEVKITSARVSNTNKALIKKLQQLVTDTVHKTLTDYAVLQKLQSVQKLLNVLSDGVLRTSTLEALNVPLHTRSQQLALALNYLRWINQLQNNNATIVVNIPSANLNVYQQGKNIFYSKIIVGKASTPTPTLSSRVAEVILYPYWSVPHSIATKELLPKIKHDVGYLDRNNFQVLNKAGKVVSPYSISWRSLSAANFPYSIRQSTGCDNSLGVVKLNFYNPFSVYLHDTPSKGLFSLNRRYFSHGCMRVELAMDLARLVLGTRSGLVDEVEEKGCPRDQPPIVLPAAVPMNVLVLYSTGWFSASGEPVFFEDVYGRQKLLAAIR